MEGRCDEPGGDEHEHEPRQAEEAGEVEPDAAAVDPVADARRHADPEQGADTGRERRAARVERGEQEHGRLEPLAQHGENGHPDERPGGARGQGRCGRILEVALHSTCMAAHPDDHVGDHHHGRRSDHRLEPVLLRLRQAG